MRTTRLVSTFFGAAVVLMLASCAYVESRRPVSDPHQAKLDNRLIGLWRWQEGDISYLHVGRAGGKLPASAMRVIPVSNALDAKLEETDLLAFSTILDNKNFVSIAECKPSQLKRLVENGWTDDSLSPYWIFQYQITGDVLTLQFMDSATWKQAIKTGKIKGTLERDAQGVTRVYCTDTMENLAKFVTESGDTLFDSRTAMTLNRVE